MSKTSSENPLNFEGIYPRQIAGKVYKLATINEYFLNFD